MLDQNQDGFSVERANELLQCTAANQEQAEDGKAWCILKVEFVESMYNSDRVILGQAVGDPDYFTVDWGTIYFIKVQGEPLAKRLLRLFDLGMKPYIEHDGEIRIRVKFSYSKIDLLDEDELFLIEEELESTQAEIARLDQAFLDQSANLQGVDLALLRKAPWKYRPLPPEMLSRERFYDQARRWLEKLVSADSKGAKVVPEVVDHNCANGKKPPAPPPAAERDNNPAPPESQRKPIYENATLVFL
jgi:hypothetical protein